MSDVPHWHPDRLPDDRPGWARRDDAELEAELRRSRERRARAARLMVACLLLPLAAQTLTVVLGVALAWGLAAVVVPAVVVWIVWRGRT